MLPRVALSFVALVALLSAAWAQEIDVRRTGTVPLLRPPAAIVPETDRYIHFGFADRLPGGRYVYVYYDGTQHESGAPSRLEAIVSADGLQWSTPVVLCGENGVDECRGISLGVSSKGDMLAIYLQGVPADPAIGRQTGDPARDVSWTLQERRTSDGQSWTEPRRLDLVEGSPSKARGSQMIVYGHIDKTPSGRLVGMSYLGSRNWAMVSDDDGKTWTMKEIVDTRNTSSDMGDINEMAVEAFDDDTWVAVARVGMKVNAMRQFVTHDGGNHWQDMGALPLPLSGGYVSPELVSANDAQGRKWLILSMMARRSKGATPSKADNIYIMAARADDAARTTGSWCMGGVLDPDASLKGRSGYPSMVVDSKSDTALVVSHSELTPTTAIPLSYAIDLKPMLAGDGAVCAGSGLR